MNGRWSIASLAWIVTAALSAAQPSFGQEDDLDYRPRGNRSEGIKTRPVAGNHVELLSARIERRGDASLAAGDLAVGFFLDEPAQVRITVREIDYKTYYWLDQVKPASPWRAGERNVFRWPAADVVSHLGGLEPSNLGALVRLGNYQAPSLSERVAPAELFGSSRSSGQGAYLFTFRVRDDANLSSALYRNGRGDAMQRQSFPHQPGGRAFTVRWDPVGSGAPEGSYRLILQGYFLDTNDPISQTVDFYHPAAR